MDQHQDIITTLKTIPLFLELSSEQLLGIARISHFIELDPGDIPIQEGGKLDLLYIILEGEIKVDVFVPSIGQVETCRLSTHDIIGWSAMTPMVRQRTGTTTSITHCWLLGIDGSLLFSLCEDDHDIGFAIYRRVSNVAARSFLTTRLQLTNLVCEFK